METTDRMGKMRSAAGLRTPMPSATPGVDGAVFGATGGVAAAAAAWPSAASPWSLSSEAMEEGMAAGSLHV
jgi:hypothetical protein